jgi:hypothetical protein
VSILALEHFSPEQQAVIASPPSGKTFLLGPAGTGKTATAVARLLRLVDLGIPADQILILVPQRTLAQPYYDLLRQPAFPAGSSANIVTLGGLAQRMISLFWPLIAEPAGFGHIDQPPTFLNLESSQYYMARLVKPLLAQGYFETIHLDINRLYSQILDNLNKAALVGFDYLTISERLKSSWVGKPEQLHAYDEAQECANLFRSFCLQNNLLDFSLQVEVFTHHLWTSVLPREYLVSTYRHLIYDNVEEDSPAVHDILSQWLTRFESALVIYDNDGGYRSFLGADPDTGWALQDSCDQVVQFTRSWVTTPQLENFHQSITAALHRQEMVNPQAALKSAVQIIRKPYYPQLLDWVAGQVRELVQERQVPPGEITILAPFLSDSLRFTLMDRLEQAGIPNRSHRPSRSLREEPATHCLLTLAKIAHPQWNLVSSHFDVRMALMHTIQDLDLVRADILSQIVYRPNRFQQGLTSFDNIRPESRDRISYSIGQRFSVLSDWLNEYRQGEPTEMDVFLSRLFGEVLSQPGFGFYQNFDSASVAARLIESVQRFRWAAATFLQQEQKSIGKEYIQMVEEGVLAAQYLQTWLKQNEDAVFVAPAYTFLISNKPVSYQFWLDIGSLGWWERLFQPLTHPVVLSRRWPEARIWTDADEYEANQQSMDHLITGLIRRCREGIFLCSAGLNERGEEPRGPLLQALQTILRRSNLREGSYAG